MNRSRRLQGRLGPGNNFPQTSFSNFEEEPMSRSWQTSHQRYRSSNVESLEDLAIKPSSSLRGDLRSHPYLNQRRNMSTLSSNNAFIDSDVDAGPRPLISPERVEQLRSRQYRSGNSFDPSIEVWERERYDHEEESYSPPTREPLDVSEYLKEEQKTKQRLEEIIMVAQALREKLDKEDDMRRRSEYIEPVEVFNSSPYREPVDDYNSASYGPVEDFDRPPVDYEPDEVYDNEIVRYSPPSPPRERPRLIPNPNLELFENPETEPGKIPSLLDLKPKIPSLLDLYVPPPPVEKVVKERLLMATSEVHEPGAIDKCWNCQKSGHRYVKCPESQKRKFCYRCGRVGFDVTSCPYCQLFKLL